MNLMNDDQNDYIYFCNNHGNKLNTKESIIIDKKKIEQEPIAEEPVAEEPVAEEPVAEEPVAEEQVVEEPVAEEPVAEEPVAEEPVAEEQVVEEPVVEEPVAEEPAEKPIKENSLIKKHKKLPSFSLNNLTINIKNNDSKIIIEIDEKQKNCYNKCGLFF